MADQQKYCNRPGCGAPIKWIKRGTRNVPLNMDDTDHHCNPAAPATQEKDDSLTGTYQGITLKRVNIVRKDKKILVSPATPKLMADLADPANPLKIGMKVKVIFTKNGEADIIEICPDQPAPVAPKTTETAAPAAQEKPPETRTSPVAPPAAIIPPPARSPEDCIRTAMGRIMPAERVGYRISLAGMVSSVIEMEKISTDAPKTYAELEADVKKKALDLFLWCDRMTMQTIKDVP